MALTADQVVVRLHAEVAQYQQNMRQAEAAATRFDTRSSAAVDHVAAAAARMELKASTALGSLGGAFSNLSKGAIQTGAGVERALDRLAASSGPQRLSNQLDELIRKQLEFGRMTAIRPQNLPGLGGASYGVDPFKPVSDSAEKAGQSVKNMQFNVGNIAAQFNDIGVTAAMGMSPMLIALQQGTQLSQAFVGQKLADVVKGLGASFKAMVSPVSLATIGLVAVTAAVAQWAIAALASGRDTKTLEESLKSLRDAIGRVREAQEALAQNRSGGNLDALRKEYGAVTAEVLRLVEAQRRLAEIDAMAALNDIRKKVEEITSASRGLIGALTDIGDGGRMNSLRISLGLTMAEAQGLFSALENIANAKGPQEQADAYDRARGILGDIVNRQGASNKEAVELYRNLTNGESETRRLLAALGLVPGAIDAATSSASGLVGELMRAVSAAQQLANAGISDLRRAEIELQYRTDPVGRAAALAAERFDAQTVTGGADAHIMARERAEYIANAEAAAKLLLQRDKLNEADREAERLANRKSRGGGAKTTPQQRAVERFDDRILKEIEALNAEADALARLPLGYDEYGNAVAAARKEAEMLQDLQNKGVKLTPQLREQVRNLALDWYEVADAAAQARERHQEFESQLEGFRSTQESAFKGLITGAESFSSALSKVLDKLADIALSSAFDNLWGAGLGKASGGLLGGLLPGFSVGGYTGSGGRNQAAGIVHKGEYVMSAPAVQRIGLENLEALHKGGSVGSQPKITINNNAPGAVVSADYVTKDEVILTVSQAIASNNRRQSDQQYLRGGR